MNGLDEIFRMAAQVAGMGLLAVVALLWVIYALHRLGVARRICRCLHLFRCSYSWIGRLCVVPMVCVLIVMGSEKPGGDGVSSVPRRLLRLIRQVVTSNDVARGYRAVEGTESGGVSIMSSGAVTNELLRRRGGYDYAFRVEPESWRFPYRDGFLDGVTVLARGEVRPDIGTIYFPVPITNGVSLLPEARWGWLPHAEPPRRRDASVFWHGLTASNSLVLTWENALVGRDLNCPTNLQLELFCDGSFTWRTDDSSQFYLPVFPFDWDGDGLENSVDPEPLVANPADAHGTNAEWYRIVCSNVFTTVSQTDSSSVELPGEDEIYFQTNANPRAYYFVDVVASNEPVPIYFTADGTSDLGDPVVVALADVTNHVPLLLGATYSVTSTVPFAVYVPTNEVIVVATNSPCDYVIRRPLSITVNGDDDDGGRFSIDEDGRLGGSVYSAGECCCDLAAVGFPCNWGNGCSCNGCTNTYYYGYCGYSLSLGTWSCGCAPITPPPPTTPSGASFSITFSESVVIFEDAYDNSPTEHVNRRSTQSVLTISLQGGQYGGRFRLTKLRGFEKLCTPDGGSVSPLETYVISSGQPYVQSYTCEGIVASGSENDIEIEGEFVENMTSERLQSTSRLTVVQLLVMPKILFPSSLMNRHQFGVCERVECYHFPSILSSGTWDSSGNVLCERREGNRQNFRCLLAPGSASLVFTCKSLTYNVQISCVEPSAIVCSKPVVVSTYGVPTGCVGGVGMVLSLTLCPSNVSFGGVRVIEQAANGTHTGYFNQSCFSNWWNHTKANGANSLVAIGDENDFEDSAEMEGACPQLPGTGGWSLGDITWTIPVKWLQPSDFSISTGFHSLTVEQQKFTINPVGTVGVEKFKRRVERPINGPAIQTVIQ